MRLARVLLLGLVALSLFEAARQWRAAPAVVPSHFDAAGRPNAWSPRNEFFELQVGVTLGIAALFVGLPMLLKGMPAGLINLPNKAYWLAPDRREETMERLSSFLDVFALATVLLLLAVFELSYRASRGGSLDPGAFLPVLLSYLVFTAGWTVAMIRAFARVPGAG